MHLSDFKPHAQLVTRETVVSTPRYPVIDAHNHLAEPFGGGWDLRPVPELLDRLDQAHIEAYVDLDGGWGEEILHRHLDYFKNAAPERFLIFGGVNWSAWPEHGNRFGEWAARTLREQKARGAQGLKIWKPFGLQVTDHLGERVKIDDRRLDPLWQTAAELRIPVMIHVADPVAFFEPLDERNERWEELQEHPDWHVPSPPYPAFADLMGQLRNLVCAHDQTTFIGAHVGCYAENLDWVSDFLDSCPNLFVDVSARLSELGRQPYSARRFFTKHADRVLFGTDAGPSLNAYRTYFRFLETDDEHFPYGAADPPTQGRWRIHGVDLPDQVLEKIYANNAREVLGIGSARG
jgi:predicted TIM-barrel fold metal-dependent hydrolase